MAPDILKTRDIPIVQGLENILVEEGNNFLGTDRGKLRFKHSNNFDMRLQELKETPML